MNMHSKCKFLSTGYAIGVGGWQGLVLICVNLRGEKYLRFYLETKTFIIFFLCWKIDFFSLNTRLFSIIDP